MTLGRWMLVAVCVLQAGNAFGVDGPAKKEDQDVAYLRKHHIATDAASLIRFLRERSGGSGRSEANPRVGTPTGR